MTFGSNALVALSFLLPTAATVSVGVPVAAAIHEEAPQAAPAALPGPAASPAIVTDPAVAPNEVQPAVPAAAVVAEQRVHDPRQIECIAKVVVHEAGSEPVRGQRAVAQVIRTRIKDGRFGADACAVVKQRGQFFNVDAYDPPRDNARWSTAVAIAHDVLSGTDEEVAPGALFFHAVASPMPRRTRVAQIGGHVFYR